MDRPRILIADEDDVLARTISWLLKEQGFDVTVTLGGERLLEALAEHEPDLLMFDVMMRGVDGYDLLHRINADPRWRDMPVLVVSALPTDEATARLLSLGATDFVSKPFHVRELLARIRMQLRVRQELLHARSALRSTEVELDRVRTEAENRRKIVDILHEVTGDFSSEELYHILVRRVARALDISHCSLVLARPGDQVGVVAAAYEAPGLAHLEIRLERYPEIRAALETGEPVLIEDVDASALYNDVRLDWAAAGTLVPYRSVVALPFRLDGEQAGVIFLRTLLDEAPLATSDVEFADTVVRAAVAAIRRAQMIESTRADKARFEVLALTDPLTQTHNRRALMERLTSELERARRYALHLSVLMVDLDHFKAINDSYGHVVGDEVLRGVSRVLQREARAVDVVARFGGEEFVVVLPETGEDGAVALAERIRARVEETPPVTGGEYGWLRVTVSIGVATVPSPRVNSPEELIAVADEALYRAKAQGRNRVCS
ncbi:MAG TPA: diguanylate cyclase [Gemmatimonadaceae bacterium]|nr:diguanylate cyclase [Gemmatimonadaceae bacterium]